MLSLYSVMTVTIIMILYTGHLLVLMFQWNFFLLKGNEVKIKLKALNLNCLE